MSHHQNCNGGRCTPAPVYQTGVDCWPTPPSCVDGPAIPGTVFNVTASLPLSSTGGSSPNLSLLLPIPLIYGGTGAATEAGARSNLGLGDMALQNSAAVIINGGFISGTNLINLHNPLNAQDAATKAYVDSISAGLTIRASVDAASTGDVVLAGEQNIDGYVTLGSRVLLKDQLAPAENGIYTTAAGAWARALDSDIAGELLPGYYYFVQFGTANINSGWVIQTAPTVLGVDPVVFTQFSAANSYSAGPGLSLVGTQFLVDPAGITTSSVTSAAATDLSLTAAAGQNLNLTASAGGIIGLNAITTLLTGDEVLNNNKLLQWRDSGGTIRTVLHMFADDNVYVDNDAAGARIYSRIAGTPITEVNANGLIVNGIFVIGSNASLRTSKNDYLHLTINVKDYGAVGDGATDDTLAFTNAIAALPANAGILYIPAGRYHVITNDSTITPSGFNINSKTNLTIMGDGWGSSVVKSIGSWPGGRVINVQSTCAQVDIHGLTFDGGCVARTAGQQAVVIDCTKVSFHDNYIINSGEFALCLGRNSPVSDALIYNNYLGLNFADGINLFRVSNATVTGNLVDGADDDLVALGECINVNVTGNTLRSRDDLGTAWGRGIAVLGGCDGITVTGNLVENVKQYGLLVSADGGVRPNDITLVGNTFRNVAKHSGCGALVQTVNNVSLIDNRIYNPAAGDCLMIADWNNLVVQGGVLTQELNQYCRGIHTDESPYTNTTWGNLVVRDVSVNLLAAANNESVSLNPHASITMDRLSVTGIVSNQVVAANYIYVDVARVGNVGKICNNTKLQAANTVTPAVTTGVVTVANNN